jgi:integrase
MPTIRKRNNSYEISVSCGYDINGRQIRRTTTYKPEKGMTAKQIEKEVQRQAVLFEEQCNNGTIGSDGKMKLADFVPIYLENAKHRLSPVVYEKYCRMLDICIVPMLGHLKLKDIKPIHIQRFINALEERETHLDGTGGKLSSSTIRRYYTMVQSVLHSAYKLGLIGVNPADSDRITLPKVEEQTTEIFTDEELTKLLDCLEPEPLQFKLLIHLALNTGCRRGELVGLKWSDINYNTGILTVSRSNYKLTGDSEIKSKSTKTGKSRTIMLPPYCLAMLKQFRAEQAQTQLLLGDRWQGDNWIFTQADGKPMYPTTPTLQFSRFLKRNGLEHKKFHALRHTSATLLLSNGTNIKNVATRLGHSQLKTTNRYVHAVEQAEKEAANTFETLLNTNSKRA